MPKKNEGDTSMTSWMKRRIEKSRTRCERTEAEKSEKSGLKRTICEDEADHQEPRKIVTVSHTHYRN